MTDNLPSAAAVQALAARLLNRYAVYLGVHNIDTTVLQEAADAITAFAAHLAQAEPPAVERSDRADLGEVLYQVEQQNKALQAQADRQAQELETRAKFFQDAIARADKAETERDRQAQTLATLPDRLYEKLTTTSPPWAWCDAETVRGFVRALLTDGGA